MATVTPQTETGIDMLKLQPGLSTNGVSYAVWRSLIVAVERQAYVRAIDMVLADRGSYWFDANNPEVLKAAWLAALPLPGCRICEQQGSALAHNTPEHQ
jgi:hypothetical protein